MLPQPRANGHLSVEITIQQSESSFPACAGVLGGAGIWLLGEITAKGNHSVKAAGRDVYSGQWDSETVIQICVHPERCVTFMIHAQRAGCYKSSTSSLWSSHRVWHERHKASAPWKQQKQFVGLYYYRPQYSLSFMYVPITLKLFVLRNV